MTTTKKDPEIEDLAKAVNGSGFPLQLGIQRVAASNPRWTVELTEHAWSDPLTGDEKFIDLVIRDKDARSVGPMRIVIESKRAARTEWIVLRENEPQDAHDDNRLNAVVRVLSRSQTKNTVFNTWVGVPFVPGTTQADFCVIRRDGQRSQDLLEKVAAELVRATDALATHEDTLHARQRADPSNQYPPISRVYIPMIVSTARLFICDAPYDRVDLETGQVNPSMIREVPAVRFIKSFGSLAPERSIAKSIREFAEATQRTVIVVQAARLNELLTKWDFGNLNLDLSAALWQKG